MLFRIYNVDITGTISAYTCRKVKLAIFCSIRTPIKKPVTVVAVNLYSIVASICYVYPTMGTYFYTPGFIESRPLAPWTGMPPYIYKVAVWIKFLNTTVACIGNINVS